MQTFYDLFSECATRWPHNIAVELQEHDQTEKYSYSDLRRMAESIGHWLLQQHVGPRARIAILADNHPRWVASYLGIIAAGHTVVPLDTALHSDQLAKLLSDSGSSLLFCDQKHLDVTKQSTSAFDIGIVEMNDSQNARSTGANLSDIFAAGPADFKPVPSQIDDLAALLYTSGTTADPKGVMLTHGNLMGEVDAIFGWVNIGSDDALLGVLPLFHVLSQMANLMLPLVKGSRVVYLETLNTTELLRALGERNITALAVVPQFFYLIHERIFKEISQRGRLAQIAVPLLMGTTRFARKFGWNPGNILFGKIHKLFGPNMRYLVTGGSRFDPEIGRSFHALGIDILQAYGLTETCGGAFATPPHHNVIGSVGPPLRGVESKLLDPQPADGMPKPVGEIAIRGPLVMKGYWNRADATQEVLRDGWLHTGDLGYFDDRGNLFITGRKKEVIVLSNGKNIYPEEVEAHYLQSPYIAEICVLGLEGSPGDPSSERLHAVIVPNFDVLKQRKIVNAKEVIRFDVEGLSAQLPSTKRIGSYEIWQDSLPRTTTRKLKRFEIERLVKSRAGQKEAESFPAERPLSREDESWLEQPDVQRAIAVLRAAARNQPQSIHPSDNLELDLGLDSMQRVELLVSLEHELGTHVDESRAADVYTVRDLVDLVRASRTSDTVNQPVSGWQDVFQRDPSDPEVLELAKPQHIDETFWFLLTRMVAMFAYDRFHLHVSGLDNLPHRGPFLLCSNHQSYIDGVIMSSVLPWQIFRDIFFVGTSEHFSTGFLRVLARWLRIMLVDPDSNLIPAMRAGAFGLRHGRVLILYPKGERSIDGSPKKFKKGAAILSIHTQVPIVPVAIEGFHEAWPRGKRFQTFAPLQICFGKPISPPPQSQASESAYDALTQELSNRVIAMWEELHSQAR